MANTIAKGGTVRRTTEQPHQSVKVKQIDEHPGGVISMFVEQDAVPAYGANDILTYRPPGILPTNNTQAGRLFVVTQPFVSIRQYDLTHYESKDAPPGTV